MANICLIVLACFLVSTALCEECSDTMKMNHCLDCTEDNYCIRCGDGYYVVPSLVNPKGGHCNKCAEHCLHCLDEKRCTVCDVGFVSYLEKCTACQEGCHECKFSPSNCTSCVNHYKLDMAGECYFRYTVVSMLGAALGLFLLLFLFFYFLGSIKRESRRRSHSNKEAGESILGDEFKQAPTLISDVTQIGRTSNVDKDLSLVIDPSEAPMPINSPEDSIREEDLFEDSGIQVEKPGDPKKNAKLSKFTKKKN